METASHLSQHLILLSISSSSVPTHRVPADDHINDSPPPSPALTHNPLGQQQQQQRHPALRLTLPQNPEEEVVVSRRGRGGLARLESPPPINRYAGDWSICGRDLLSGQEADYDEVAGSDSDGGKQTRRTVYQIYFHSLTQTKMEAATLENILLCLSVCFLKLSNPKKRNM